MPLSYDGFTVYIFGEDLAKLNSLHHGAEGSLYGLWTSTLNPVVHVVYTRRHSATQDLQVRNALADRYKMAYLGEWRVTVTGRSGPDSRLSPPSHFQPGGSNGFLALNVVNGHVTPYMYEGPTDRNPKRGSVETLQGDNPFSNDRDTSAILRGEHLPAGQLQEIPTGREGYERYHQSRHANTYAPNQRGRVVTGGEPATTKRTQWYSTDGGEKILKTLFERLKKIADREDVTMSRDTQTQDITLSFKSRVLLKDWSIEFPANFPRVGAMIRENRYYGSPVEKRTTGTIQTVIEEICRTVGI